MKPEHKKKVYHYWCNW